MYGQCCSEDRGRTCDACSNTLVISATVLGQHSVLTVYKTEHKTFSTLKSLFAPSALWSFHTGHRLKKKKTTIPCTCQCRGSCVSMFNSETYYRAVCGQPRSIGESRKI